MVGNGKSLPDQSDQAMHQLAPCMADGRRLILLDTGLQMVVQCREG